MVESKWVRVGATGVAVFATAGIGIGIGLSARKSNTSSSITVGNKNSSLPSRSNDSFEEVGKVATTNDESKTRYVDPSPKLAENFGTDDKFGSKIVGSYIMTNSESDIVDSAATEEDPCASEGGRRNLRSSVSFVFASLY